MATHLFWMLCLCFVASAYASTNADMVHKTVLNASLSRTVMSYDFDQEAVAAQAFAAQELGEFSGTGSLLAIAPTGAPVANLLQVELGEAVSSAMNLGDVPWSEQELVLVGEPAIVHGMRIVGVSVSPVLMTSEGLRAVRHVEYEVVTSGGIGINEVRNPQPLHWAFEPVLRHSIDNLDDLHPHVSLDAPARMLILGSTKLLGTDLAGQARYEDWLDLKRRKGYQVQIVTLADVYAQFNDSTKAGVRNFISATYHDESLPSLVYGIVIGDYNTSNTSFPTELIVNPEHNNESSVGDNYLFAVDGDDYIADVFHGRISGQSVAEYLAYFRKAVDYEFSPFTGDPQWFKSLTCVAGNYSDGSGTFPVTPVWNMNWAREYVMRDGCITDADTFYYHDNSESATEWTEEIVQDINLGVCAVWYRGWAGSQAWQYPVLRIQDIQNINVGGRFPAVWGIVCGSGNFAYPGGPSLGEEFTTGLGTPSAPNGAIVFFGASDLHTNTKHNNAMLAAMAQGMLVDGMRANGPLALAGKLEVYRQYPLERAPGDQVHFYGFHVFNILGDPEVPLYFCEPGNLTAAVVGSVTQGQNVVTVNVTDSDAQPVADAIVAIRDAGTHSTSWTQLTDESGQAQVPVNLGSAATAQITVWRPEYIMRHFDQAVSQIARDPHIVEGQFSAGADGEPNPGETFDVAFLVENHGTEAATWTITVASADEFSSVVNGNASTGSIAPGNSGTSSAVTIDVADHAPSGTQPVLEVTFNDGSASVTRLFSFDVAAPDPKILELEIHDDDGVLTPGETAPIFVRIKNTSETAAAALTATVHSHDNAISFPDNTLDWGAVNPGEEVTSSSFFTAALPGDVARGRQILLRFDFSWNGVPFATKVAYLTAGPVAPTVPTGPDGYGYYAYEDIDAGFSSTPTYSWTELDPAFGGVGGTEVIVYDDTKETLNLTTPFSYYGESYNTITVCSNGWLAFGTASLAEFRNWEIPSPIGPPSMVCVFWDDLISYLDEFEPNDNMAHKIFLREESGRAIVQWRTCNRAGLNQSVPNADSCIFQAILEYPQGGGDGSILFLYKEIANTDAGNNFGTVGIQDSYHLNGLGLTFANSYLPSVAPLAAGRAIRFTTTPPDAYLGAEEPSVGIPQSFAFHAAYPNPFNPSTELSFDLPHGGQTMLKIYDTLGREVATLVDANLNAGTHVARFDAAALGSGVYFARLVSGANTAVQKVVLLK
ncbi:MAG: T9SS type A sorting domain-containing protein [Calditrichaeota bacterium]|nr:T9SS type A sorting domain-containing protein [Calditrichota bacterium]MCB9391388.1 T9SS type A sorting domain-containing protein [Calditrichota bacterium]